MKFFFAIICLILGLGLASKLRTSSKKDINPEIVMTPSHELLPGTPKGTTLKNHYGADPNDSPYGPQPTLIRKEVITHYPDGSSRKENQTEVVHLPDGVISDCEISLQQFYPICFNLKTCDLCAANPYCGKKKNKTKIHTKKSRLVPINTEMLAGESSSSHMCKSLFSFMDI